MIEHSFDDGILRITLNRPDKANALTEEMLSGLADLFEKSDARCVLLTGAGRVFSAGADLDAVRAGLATSSVWERLSRAIAEFSGLTICALNGTAAGGSLGMVLACDIRLAVPSAKVFYPVMKLGFLPQPSDPIRMRNLIGASRTKMILMGGQKISAKIAEDWGLVDELVDKERLLARALEIAEDTLSADRTHAEAIKSMI